MAPAQTVCNYFNYWFTYLPNGLSDRDQVGFAFRQMLTNMPGRPDGAGEQRRLLGPAVQRQGPAGRLPPYELPILNAHAYRPTGQHDADCQGGQFGYELGQGLLPGQAPSNPAYGVAGPARLPRADDAVLQRRRQARARRHAQRVAPAGDLGEGR